MQFFYRDLAPDEVDIKVSPAVRAATARAIPALIEGLGISDLSISWFEPAPAGTAKAWGFPFKVLGLCCPLDTVVQIAVRDDPEEAVRTLAHEARHVFQYQKMGVPTKRAERTSIIEADQEADAEEYEAEFAQRFFGGPARPIRFRDFRGRELDQLKADVAAIELMLR